ncbi:uncharacterized protein METZ01_LOCUS280056 [marine metagenome]|uniref:receptor protein-tyrosine kinase n=1 Tax=marine metagenome TaxID=408172 RepID=A0A382KVP7_9ZZZZ
MYLLNRIIFTGLIFISWQLNAQVALPTFQGVQSAPKDLYSFSSHTFTSCGSTGRYGPTLSNCTNAYSPAWVDNTDYFNVTNGIQFWTVPETGTYTIEVWGARGGYSGYSTSLYGKGTKMKSDHSLTKGEIIKILIGQPGSVNSATNYQYNSSGGGGSFVWKSGASSPLVVAGGGGGGSHQNSQHSNLDANVGESGKPGIDTNGSVTQSNGGSDGSGGSGSSYSYQAGSGGGWLSDGGGGHNQCAYAVSGGKGINNNGGAGGEGGNHQGGGTNYLGGFGGGGGASGACGTSGSGGGGGYSGGGVGNTCCSSMGGGGGSYNTGSNNYSSTSLGYNTGDGKVIITKN